MWFSQQEKTAITGEILSLLEKKVIHLAESQGGNITKEQREGTAHSQLEESFLEYEHFKMEDIRSIKDLLSRNDFMCKLDLRDAYLTVPIHLSH